MWVGFIQICPVGIFRNKKQESIFPQWLGEITLYPTWDDHDYGSNDGGGSYKYKKELHKKDIYIKSSIIKDIFKLSKEYKKNVYTVYKKYIWNIICQISHSKTSLLNLISWERTIASLIYWFANTMGNLSLVDNNEYLFIIWNVSEISNQ